MNRFLKKLWTGLLDIELQKKAMKCSLYDSPLYRSWLSGDGNFSKDNPPVLERPQLAKWLDAMRKYFAKDIMWWETSGTSSGRPIKIAFPQNFHNSLLRPLYHEFIPGWREEKASFAVLCPPRIAGLCCDPSEHDLEKRIVGEEVYLSPPYPPEHWEEKDYRRLLNDLRNLSIVSLRTDPHYLMVFFRWALQSGSSLPHIPVIISSYGSLGEISRRRIETITGSRVLDLFAMSECGPLYLSEGESFYPCEEGVIYEALPEYVEPDGTPIGESYVSSIRNPLFPLVRYRTGDMFRIQEAKGTFCGRRQELIFLDNRVVISPAKLSEELAMVNEVWEYQCRLVSGRSLQLHVVPEPGADPAKATRLATECLNQLTTGKYRIEVKWVNVLTAQPSGKFCSVIPYENKAH